MTFDFDYVLNHKSTCDKKNTNTMHVLMIHTGQCTIKSQEHRTIHINSEHILRK